MGLFIKSNRFAGMEDPLNNFITRSTNFNVSKEFEASAHLYGICKEKRKEVVNTALDDIKAINVPFYSPEYTRFIENKDNYIVTTKGNISVAECVPMKDAGNATIKNMILDGISMSFIEAMLTIYHLLRIDGLSTATKYYESFTLESYNHYQELVLHVILSRIKFIRDILYEYGLIIYETGSKDDQNGTARSLDRILTTKFDYLINEKDDDLELLFINNNLLGIFVSFVANYYRVEEAVTGLCKMYNCPKIESEIMDGIYTHIIDQFAKYNSALYHMIKEFESERQIDKDHM